MLLDQFNIFMFILQGIEELDDSELTFSGPCPALICTIILIILLRFFIFHVEHFAFGSEREFVSVRDEVSVFSSYF